uniref:Structural protein n=1 Tax=Emberiza tristrami ambidensovirus TaxID=2794447 RepID=A0A8A4XCY8_9VIRU|nr:MAG: structural protein [Emberiza tristrami ambidensovirus]
MRQYSMRVHNLARAARGMPPDNYDINVNLPARRKLGNKGGVPNDISDDELAELIDFAEHNFNEEVFDEIDTPEEARAELSNIHTSQEAGPSHRIDEPPAKRIRPDEPPPKTTTSAPTTVPPTTTMGPPHTPMDQSGSADSTSAGGQGTPAAAAGGVAGPQGQPRGLIPGGGMAPYRIPRPRPVDEFEEITYGKQFKFHSFGIAWKGLAAQAGQQTGPPLIAAHTIYFTTTSLAELPVDKPYFYMDPAEFNNLNPGSYCTAVHCKVSQRNAIQQFETGATTTNLATLNQNKNAIYAYGLNLTGMGMNRYYSTFDATQTMVPTASTTPIYVDGDAGGSYVGFVGDAYGFAQPDLRFNTILPKHNFGEPIRLQNYWNFVTHSLNNDGWMQAQHLWHEWDASQSIAQQVCEYSYHPAMAPLNPPLKDINTHVPIVSTGFVLESSSGYTGRERLTAAPLPADGSVSTVTHSTVANNAQQTTIMAININTPLEKSQFLKSSIRDGFKAQSQPSFHIGMKPVHSLTTSAGFSDNSTFTDCRIDWDVTTHMTVRYRKRTERSYQTAQTIPTADRVWQTSGGPEVNLNSVIYNGLYTNTQFTANAA